MAMGLGSSNAGPPHLGRLGGAAGGRAGLAIAAGLLVILTGAAPGASALGAPGGIAEVAREADPPGLASGAPYGSAPNRCDLAAHPVGSEHARDALSNAEWMDTRVVIANDGHVTVATRLASGLRRPLAAEVTVSFLTEDGARIAVVARSYRLAERSVHTSTAPKERVRAGVMRLQLAPSARCRLARVRIDQHAIPS